MPWVKQKWKETIVMNLEHFKDRQTSVKKKKKMPKESTNVPVQISNPVNFGNKICRNTFSSAKITSCNIGLKVFFKSIKTILR